MVKTCNEIRQAFLDFFASKDHVVVPSSSLIPHNDPTLLFTNAGMVPFKNMFSGVEHVFDANGKVASRATSAQKCIRAGGKHNDLDNVGYTARHHTFFEMLGNFSFGDYFKEDAIAHAWELLTEVFKLPAEKLYFTVYHTDDEAYDIWKKVTGCDDSRILRVPTDDNFWSMGATGPCGPCSEIFYDHGEKAGIGEWALDENGHDLFEDRFIEIWNLVFMQFERHADGTQTDLPSPCIDTGMGLERITAVIQGEHDNYDIDLFKHLIHASKSISGNEDPALESSHRVIADHLRSTSFLLAEGIRPGSEGRGYVLRRIMRRAMRHAHILGCKEPLMHKLVPALVEAMGSFHTILRDNQEVIAKQLLLEEERFRETLARGLSLLDDETGGMKAGDKLAGDVAFKLYDTYGFPLDLTQDILRSRKIDVDVEGFDAAMAEQKKRARAAWKGAGDAADNEIWLDLLGEHGATEFVGYTALSSMGTVIALVKDGKLVDALSKGDKGILLTNQTPFYGESGGQSGDQGMVEAEGMKAKVTDTQKPLGKLHAHSVEVQEGVLKVDQNVGLKVDGERREGLKIHHSATHLLHAVLRKILGDHVTQKGSLVEADYLRFDFSHDAAVTAEELLTIEREVNRLVRQNSAVGTEVMTPDAAKEKGAMALFGEKYGDEVRVLSMGLGEILGGKAYSIELCGGTHADYTGDIGYFRISKESSVSSGVRRIEAVCGEAAFDFATTQAKQLAAASAALKSPAEELPERIKALQEHRKAADMEIQKLKKQVAMGGGGASGTSDAPEKVGDVTFVGKVLEGMEAKELRGVVDQYKQQIGSGVVVIIAPNEGKVALVVGVTDDLTERFNAVEFVRLGSELLGGKGGGGRPDFAQAGGADASQADEVLAAVKAKLA